MLQFSLFGYAAKISFQPAARSVTPLSSSEGDSELQAYRAGHEITPERPRKVHQPRAPHTFSSIDMRQDEYRRRHLEGLWVEVVIGSRPGHDETILIDVVDSEEAPESLNAEDLDTNTATMP
jgi:hypothetical protein